MDRGKVIDSKELETACEGKWYWGLENICTKKQNPKSVKRSLFWHNYIKWLITILWPVTQ